MSELELSLTVVLTEHQLRHLETSVGPGARLMGSWQTDGAFGYITVSFETLHQAADALGDPNLTAAVALLKSTPNRTEKFVELIETFGPALVERIIAAYMFSQASTAKATAKSGT